MSYEGGTLDDLTEAPPKDFFERTMNPSASPDGESEITIDFENGVPVGLNGTSIPPVQIIEDLNEIGGTNGIGRMDLVEDCNENVKSRGIYETPGGTLITTAHRELESLVLDRQTRHQKEILAINYAQLVYDGYWFSPLREALDAFFAKTNEKVKGSITLSLYKGNIVVKSRKSPNSLYRADIASLAAQAHL
jgi:argininosuccinate synthase